MDSEIKAAMDDLTETAKGIGTTLTRVGARLGKLESDMERMGELEAKVGRMRFAGGSEGFESEIEVSAKALARFRDNIKAGGAGDIDFDQERARDYREAFLNYARRGDQGISSDIRSSLSVGYVRNELSVGSDPAGGYLVPPVVADEIIRRTYDQSPVRQIARVFPLGSGDALEFPNDAGQDIGAGWVGETEARTETTNPKFGASRIPVNEGYCHITLTQKMLDDAQVDIADYLVDRISDRLARLEGAALTAGNGVGKPTGFISYGTESVTTADDSRTWGVLQYVASGAAGAFPIISGLTADDVGSLITLKSKLKAKYRQRAVWVMNRATAAVLERAKDDDGRFLWIMALTKDTPDRLLGYPVVLLEDMPDMAADSFSIGFGDFTAGYTIADRATVTVLRDPFTSKGSVVFYVTFRVGGDVVDFNAIKLMKFAAS